MDRSIETERIQRDIDWYDELLAYRDIGTPEELLRLKEKEKQEKWIPVLERLPKNDGFYLVSYPPYHIQYKKEKIDNAIEYCYFENEKFFIIADGLHAKNECWKEELTSVIAWRELPDAYNSN